MVKARVSGLGARVPGFGLVRTRGLLSAMMNSMNSTSGNGELEAAVSHLWQELADVAGCVSTWLRGNGSLDDRRGSILHRRITDLNRILPVLGGADNAPYWPRLYRLPCLVSEADPRPTE